MKSRLIGIDGRAFVYVGIGIENKIFAVIFRRRSAKQKFPALLIFSVTGIAGRSLFRAGGPVHGSERRKRRSVRPVCCGRRVCRLRTAERIAGSALRGLIPLRSLSVTGRIARGSVRKGYARALADFRPCGIASVIFPVFCGLRIAATARNGRSILRANSVSAVVRVAVNTGVFGRHSAAPVVSAGVPAVIFPVPSAGAFRRGGRIPFLRDRSGRSLRGTAFRSLSERLFLLCPVRQSLSRPEIDGKISKQQKERGQDHQRADPRRKPRERIDDQSPDPTGRRRRIDPVRAFFGRAETAGQITAEIPRISDGGM